MIDYSPIGAVGQAAIEAGQAQGRLEGQQLDLERQRLYNQMLLGTEQAAASALRNGQRGGQPLSNAGTGEEVHGYGYVPGQAQYAVPGSDTQQGTDAGSGAIDPETGQPIDQTAAAMPAAPTTFTVSPQQKQQLANIDADSSMSDFDKQAARRKVLGQPAPTIPYTITNADGSTSTVNLTPQQAQQAAATGQKISIAQQRADTSTAAQKDQADYHGQLVDIRNKNMQQQWDMQSRTLDQKTDALQRQYELAMDKEGDSRQKQVYKMGSDEQKALEGALRSDTSRAKEYLNEYVEAHPTLRADDPELLKRQQLIQSYMIKEAQAKQAWQQNLAQELAIVKTQQPSGNQATAQQSSQSASKSTPQTAAGPTASDGHGNRVQWNGSAWVPLK